MELFVKEMMSASDMDDAKARASRVLEVLEKSIYARASADAAQSFHQVLPRLSSLLSAVYRILSRRMMGFLEEQNLTKCFCLLVGFHCYRKT